MPESTQKRRTALRFAGGTAFFIVTGLFQQVCVSF